MNHHQQPHHIDELAAPHPAGDRLEEGTGQRKRTHNAFGRPYKIEPEPGSPEENKEQLLRRIRRAVGEGSHRTHNAFGRPLHETAATMRDAFGRLLDDDKEN